MKLKRFIFLLFLFFSLYPFGAKAEFYFNPHFIISDDEATDFTSLSLQGIQNFLADNGSALARLTLPDYEGNDKTAAEIIWNASQESRISPKLLLATLQKEQSLVTSPIPTQNQLNKAMGYRCPDNGVCNPKAFGFGKQVDAAAWQFRQYFNNPSDWYFRPNQTYNIDGFTISPANQATASLYNYTPHESGNRHFWQIWQNFWGKDFPDGSLIKASGDPAVWLVQYGTRRPIASWSVLLSRFDPKKIVTVNLADLEKYEVGPAIKFTNYSLLKRPDGQVFLLVDDELRHIASEEVFRNIGFNWAEVEAVTDSDLAAYFYGTEITLESAYPVGALLQDKITGGVYFVENGIKHPVTAYDIMIVNFKNRVLTTVSTQELDKYQTGNPVLFRDGELIQANGDPKVYVISNGTRRWIMTADAFAKFGYKWDNIIVTSSSTVALHPLGDNIE
ncbi:MAG: hypothetical protein PHW95_04615 [Patescibacteria group bacterium]|nr:hypothetical protein [Patescibacteria group bacterium]